MIILAMFGQNASIKKTGVPDKGVPDTTLTLSPAQYKQLYYAMSATMAESGEWSYQEFIIDGGSTVRITKAKSDSYIDHPRQEGLSKNADTK